MKAIRKYSGGGITDDRSPRMREMDRKKKAKQIKDLEGQIASVKGTPAAKALVQKYRLLTGTQK